MGLDWIGIEKYDAGDGKIIYFKTMFRGKSVSHNDYFEDISDDCYGEERTGLPDEDDHPGDGYYLTQEQRSKIITALKKHIEDCKNASTSPTAPRCPSKKVLKDFDDTKENYISWYQDAIDFLESEELEDIYCWF